MSVYGMKLADLPEGWVALDAAVVVKALDETGDLTLWFAQTESLTGWEKLGMLIASSDDVRRDLGEVLEDG